MGSYYTNMQNSNICSTMGNNLFGYLNTSSCSDNFLGNNFYRSIFGNGFCSGYFYPNCAGNTDYKALAGYGISNWLINLTTMIVGQCIANKDSNSEKTQEKVVYRDLNTVNSEIYDIVNQLLAFNNTIKDGNAQQESKNKAKSNADVLESKLNKLETERRDLEIKIAKDYAGNKLNRTSDDKYKALFDKDNKLKGDHREVSKKDLRAALFHFATATDDKKKHDYAEQYYAILNELGTNDKSDFLSATQMIDSFLVRCEFAV